MSNIDVISLPDTPKHQVSSLANIDSVVIKTSHYIIIMY